MQPSFASAVTPLRYPGAKKKALKKLLPFLRVEHDEYREPFVGGGAIFFGKPSQAQTTWINDLDEDVSAFFCAMRDHPHDLCDLVESTIPSLDTWRTIKNGTWTDTLHRGFRTLFLNRTNYSGILSANPIGGLREPNPKYPIGCRWNPVLLQQQIMACSLLLQGVEITSLDFIEVLQAPPQGQRTLIVLDPPYYEKGNSLYQKKMYPQDHERLAAALQQLDPQHFRFLLTYDDCEEVRALYQGWTHFYTEKWYYSTLQTTGKRVKGNELFITNYQLPASTNAEV